MKHRVAAVQMEHDEGNKTVNWNKMEKMIAGAQDKGIQTLAFPECCISGYVFLSRLPRGDLVELAEPVPQGPSTQRMLTLARQNHMNIGAGLVEIDQDGMLYNTYVLAMHDGRYVRHRKIHQFISTYLVSGSEHMVFETPEGVKMGILICYDNNIYENSRILALKGAEVILSPHQTSACFEKIDLSKWAQRNQAPKTASRELREKGRTWLLRWLPSRAHDNGLYIIFSNGIGLYEEKLYWGNALVLGPKGEIAAATDSPFDTTVPADIETTHCYKCMGRRSWMRSRRPELYGLLAERTGNEVDTRFLLGPGSGKRSFTSEMRRKYAETKA